MSIYNLSHVVCYSNGSGTDNKFSIFLVLRMVRAKNYETVSTFCKLWPLFFRTRCISTEHAHSASSCLLIGFVYKLSVLLVLGGVYY